jgi:ATP-dependent helicase/DNAse subunit B
MLQLTSALGMAAVNARPGRSGRVLVTSVTDARGLPHKHVFIPGLSEGVFPAPLDEDPIYLDTERATLTQRGIFLQTQAERASDESLFYELVSLAHDSLTLSRPTVLDGAPWLASHLWREAAAVFSDAASNIATNRVKMGAVLAADDVAAPHEAALAVADSLNQSHLADSGLYNWLLAERGADWRRINTARRVERERTARHLPFDRYSGRLSDPLLVDAVRSQLHPDRLWSASQLNDYGLCGFRFFAKRLLRLDTLEDPEDDLDGAKLGTINHDILENAYAEYIRRGLRFDAHHADEAVAILRALAAPILQHAPQVRGFRETARWQQEKITLLQQLESLVRLDFSDQSPVVKKFGVNVDGAASRRTLRLEAEFGRHHDVQIPIVVDGHEEPLHVLGYIDRIDQVGDAVIVIDYKTGSKAIPVSDMREGRNFQMMVYLWAAKRLLAATPSQAIGGLFWHIRTQQSSGDLLWNSDDGEAAVSEAEAHIGRSIAAGRRGDFTVKANKPTAGRCAHYCEFSQFCRAASTHQNKP